MRGLTTAGTRLLMFGGKGGVGKTTCAAATALALAEQMPDRRVLLLSADPAHSLGDVFERPVSDIASTLEGGPVNLVVREIDSARGFRQTRERYASAIDALFDRLSRGSSGSVGLDARHDRQVMHSLIDLAPPGIDELAAVIEVTGALDEPPGKGPDLVVMDTAPSGHALRLLEMPVLARAWARALMSILLKYRPVAGVGELGTVLLHLSQGLGRLRTLVEDPRRTSFVVVTRAAVLPREETARLLKSLRRMNVHVPAVIVNVVGRGTCARCRKASAAEARQLAGLRRSIARVRQSRPQVLVAPAMLPPPQGPDGLREWRQTWRTGAES